MKVERGFDSEILQVKVLSDDYSKLAFLCADRNIEFHAQYGKHFKIRIPKFGRDICYNPNSADLYAVGASNEIYRLNLSMGRFQSPLISDSEEINCIDYSSKLELAATGGIDGRVQFWNMLTKGKAHDMILPANCQDQEITQIKFEPTQAM
jgi:ribosome biogenesis protein ENP2